MTHPSRKPLGYRANDSWGSLTVSPLPVNHPNVRKAIELLEEIDDFDGETMEYIISQLFMRGQMLKQLVGTCDWADVVHALGEREGYSK